jgi:DNA-binding NtrC family response regulator
MTTTASSQKQELLAFVPRQRDRRLGLGDVVMAAARAIADRSDPNAMRAAFEDVLQRVVPVAHVAIREGNKWGRNDNAESISLEVPGAPVGAPAMLEASFDPATHLGDWDFQLLGFAAHLGGLVLEVERARQALARAGLGGNIKGRRDGAAPLIGSTAAMRTLRTRIERVAHTDFTILLEGESGVGKELVARQIHDLSTRRAGPFVAINCAALVETLLEAELFGIEERTATGVRGRRGKFEHADGGTLFLDEVSDLSLSAQAKLLRAIQDLAVERVGGTGTHRLDIRIVAATNKPLPALVDQKLFRADLFYRLSGVDVRVPPLRERRDDILELAAYFLERHRGTRRLRLSPAAADAIGAYHWPGNVRELERFVERAVALAESDVIEMNDLPPAILGECGAALIASLDRHDTLRAWGSRYVHLMLKRADGNKREACRLLDISYHTLVAYLKFEHGDTMPPALSPADAGNGPDAASREAVEA